MEAKTRNTKLMALEPGLSKEELYELYLSGRPMFVEVEITHDKAVVLNYLEPLREMVVPTFASIFDDLWEDILDDDILGRAIWKTQSRNNDAFNKYTLYKILGVLLHKSVFVYDLTAAGCSQMLESTDTAEVYRPCMSKGLDRDSILRLRKILQKFESV